VRGLIFGVRIVCLFEFPLKISAYPKNIWFSDRLDFDGIVVAGYVAFHAFGASVQGAVADEVYLGRAAS
jgi:hypothetical protein